MPPDVVTADGPAPVRTEHDERALRITWSDGRVSTFLHFWLHDNCPGLRHTTTDHRVVETSTIPLDVRPATVQVAADSTVTVTWAHDGHVSVFDGAWLRAHDYSNGARYARREPVLWDATSVASLPRSSHDAVVHDIDARRALLAGFHDHGVALVHGVPTEPGTVLQVAQLLGDVRVTHWGRSFDVVSVDDANSLAYTSLPLVTHTDEAYRDPAPTVQLQHFLRAEASGGAATLVDGFRVAHDLKAERPDLFELLATVPLRFHYRAADAELAHDAPVLTLDAGGGVRAVRYSNHSAQPFLMEPELLERYYEAYLAFGRIRESHPYLVHLDLGAGDMYVVDNQRVLHGRTGFTRGGSRHLQSCYIERDELLSRLALLER